MQPEVQTGKRKTFFVVNPVAGGGKAKDAWKEILAVLIKSHDNFSWQYTKCNGSAIVQVMNALDEGYELIVAVGGDGTLNEAVNGFIKDGKLYKENTALAFWPLGSGCDMARTIFPDKEPQTLLDMLQFGEVKMVDIGGCTYSSENKMQGFCYYLNSFDTGLGANTVAAVNKSKKRLGGKISFLLSALRCIISYRNIPMRITADGQHFDGEYVMIAIGNNKYAGGGMMLTPKAVIDDGRLDMLMVKKVNKLYLLWVTTKVYSGAHLKLDLVSYHSVQDVSIETDIPMLIECDGENVGYTSVNVTVLPQALPLLFPAPKEGSETEIK